ncbi:MAG: class II glutamine amidotransferase [Thermoguttaceae bacterium]|nr:class II glutamine amidotransferase [Thermoguttaceae bacterium]
MCELFAACGKRKIVLNEYLREFFSHGERHPDGWGAAAFHGAAPSIEKEPESATTSRYLKNKLHDQIEESVYLAHIRRATIGTLVYENCHPFTKQDATGRAWTLIHNGTIFKAPQLHEYAARQKGTTDSERVLLYLVDRLDRAREERGEDLPFWERFEIIERAIVEIADGNKLNLIIYDGEYLYVHTNYANSLYYLTEEDAILFATRPLGLKSWRRAPFTTLCAYRDGELVRKGVDHGKIFVDNPEEMRYLFMDFAGL